MRFNPNYITKDNWFEVMLDIKTLTPEKAKPTGYHQSDEITKHKIIVYNTKTKRMSEKSIYYNEEKGFYFKGNTKYWNSSPHSKYYINELKEKKLSMENNIQKIKDIKSLINEFYHDMKCRGLLTDDTRKCQLSYLKDCDDIEKELEKLEKLQNATRGEE